MLDPIVAFYLDSVEINKKLGFTHDIVTKINNGWGVNDLESTHNYIQWLFPLPEESECVPGSPLMTQTTVHAFQNVPLLQEKMRFSRYKMHRLYNRSGDMQIFWITPNNHNFRRITRIIRCLKLLGLDEDATFFWNAIDRVISRNPGSKNIIGDNTWDHWMRALATPKIKL